MNRRIAKKVWTRSRDGRVRYGAVRIIEALYAMSRENKRKLSRVLAEVVRLNAIPMTWVGKIVLPDHTGASQP